MSKTNKYLSDQNWDWRSQTGSYTDQDNPEDLEYNIGKLYDWATKHLRATSVSPTHFRKWLEEVSADEPVGSKEFEERAMRSDLTIPILVKLSPHGRMSVLDGSHRIYKALKQDIDKIPAYIIPSGKMPEDTLAEIEKSSHYAPAPFKLKSKNEPNTPEFEMWRKNHDYTRENFQEKTKRRLKQLQKSLRKRKKGNEATEIDRMMKSMS